MFEGKHIHFSPTDNKPLCSYSGKLCRQRRLNGYAFCIRHILEDKSAPFKQCSYVTRNNSQKCLNAIPTNQDRGYCHSHMQVVGIIPKTERKSKATKSDSISNGTDKSLTSPASTLSSITSNGKKDPGAVFKFEEDSTDVGDLHFPYKNGLTTTTCLSNGKGKGSKGNKVSNTSYSPKDRKNEPKTLNGFSGSYTTKKITDKNKNVYTAIIPNSNNKFNNNNNNHLKSQQTATNNKKVSWNASSTDSPSLFTATKKSSTQSQVESNRSSQKECIEKDSGESSKLNKVQDAEEIRQFEQLKTLKKLAKSKLDSYNSTKSLVEAQKEDAEEDTLRIFPRLASANKSKTLKSIPLTSGGGGISTSSLPLPSRSSPTSNVENAVRNDNLSNSNPTPLPAQITRCNNGIIIKTEPKADENFNEDQFLTKDSFLSLSSGLSISKGENSSNIISSHSNSIDDSPRDFKNRQEFLAQVRNTFKSQYKSIKKSTKVSEKWEHNNKQKFRDSLMKCVKINSSICAQVLLGYGLKLPSFIGTAAPTAVVKVEQEVDHKKKDYDDYEFSDSETLISPLITKANTASFSDSARNKTKGNVTPTATISTTTGGRKNSAKSPKNEWEKGSKAAPKCKVQKKSSTSSSNNHARDKDLPLSNGSFGSKENNKDAHEFCPSKSVQNGKKVEKGRCAEVTNDQKTKQNTPATKRRLKRTDALPLLTPESSLESSSDLITNDVTSPRSGVVSENVAAKKRRLGLNDIRLNQSSPSISSLASSPFDVGSTVNDTTCAVVGNVDVKIEKDDNAPNHVLNQGTGNSLGEINDILSHSLGHSSNPRNQGLETVLNSVGSSENAGTPDGVITDASFDSTFEHSTSSQQDCEFSEDDLEHSFELQIDPEIESQASRLLEDNVLTEADFTELFPDNRMSDHKFGRSDLQELGMGGLEFDVNDIDYSLFANIFPNFSRTGGQPESISISNQF